MLPETTLQRLNTQLDAVDLLLKGVTASALTFRSQPNQWSAHENLAHVARHHQVFLDRLRRIQTEENPELGRYRAEDDPEWPLWASLPTDEVWGRLRLLRTQLIKSIGRSSDQDLERTGVHPLFGEMNLAQWLEFFLLHEAHHLYLVVLRLGQAEQALELSGEK